MKDFYRIYKTINRSLTFGHYETLFNTTVKLSEIVNEQRDQIYRANQCAYLKAKSLVSEIFDYFGRYRRAAAILESDGEDILADLRKLLAAGGPITDNQHRLLVREQVRFSLEYAQIHYRDHNYEEAQDIVEDCEEILTKLVRNAKTFPCYGSLARIQYYFGRIYRQKNRYAEAEECFRRSIDYHFLRAEAKRGEFKSKLNSRRVKEAFAMASHKSAISLALGLGWLSYTTGSLNKALGYVLPARVLLLPTQDVINKAYIDLIHGSILRSLAGDDKEKLKAAVALIRRAYKAFESHGHRAYRARAAWELSLAYLYGGDYTSADKFRREADGIATKNPDAKTQEDWRWVCNSLVVGSRIRLRQCNLTDAQALASDALKLALEHKETLCQIDAHIARAEARLKTDRPAARQDLLQALELNKALRPTAIRSAETTNPKIEAVCNLYLARSYIWDREGRRALDYIQRWRELQNVVEHFNVRELASSVEADLGNLHTDFVIPANTPNLDRKEHEKSLHNWLLQEAAYRERKQEDQNRQIGITRPTRAEWERRRGLKT